MIACIACDLGAESGRVIVGLLTDDGRLTLDEIHRFANTPILLFDTLRWNLLQLFLEMKTGLRKAVAAAPAARSLSVDSWGVDYVYFNAGQPMVSLPYCYRDARTDRTYAATVQELGAAAIFAETGIQFMAINTLYQFRADAMENQGALASADAFLGVADYFNYLFSGVARAERSLASTTQVYNPSTHQWSGPLVAASGVPARLFPPIVPSATRLGPLLGTIAAEAGAPAGGIEVIATCSHDTGAAVAAIPAAAGAADWAYLVSGTWSLMGVERPAPLLSERARELNFTNEVGHGGSIRLLKNISGLWLLQEARRDYARLGQEFDYATIVALASDAGPAQSFIHPAAARFARPGGMLEKMAGYCRETAQTPPGTPGENFRCIFESLALVYRHTLLELEQLVGTPIHVLHIAGGGCQNRLLNRLTTDAVGREVRVGPVEATAIGNLLLQAVALGVLGSLEELRTVVAQSFPIETLEPQEAARWQDAAGRFDGLRLLT